MRVANVAAVLMQRARKLLPPSPSESDRLLIESCNVIRQEVKIMSESIAAQIKAATATLVDRNAALAADVSALANDITSLQTQVLAKIPAVGTEVTQEMADELAAAVAGTDSVLAQANAIVAKAQTPFTPQPPPAPTAAADPNSPAFVPPAAEVDPTATDAPASHPAA